MTLNIRKQEGMTPIGVITIFVLIGFVVYLGFRIVPLYLEYFNVVSSVNSLQDDPDLHAKRPSQIRELLRKRFEINDIKRVTASDAQIAKSGGRTIVDVKYEARVALVGNLDVIAKFKKRGEF